MCVHLCSHTLVELSNIEFCFEELLGFLLVDLYVLLVLSLELNIHLVELLLHLIHRHCVSNLLADLRYHNRVFIYHRLQLLYLRERRFQMLQFFHHIYERYSLRHEIRV